MVKPPSAGAKVLVVDDAESIRSILRAILTEEGYPVIGEMTSAKGVLEVVQRDCPDIICLDYNLPGTQGLALLRTLHDAHPTVAIVLITGDPDPKLEDAAAEAGASGFIHKPFSQDRIARELRQVAHTQRLLVAAHQTDTPVAVESPRARAVIADDSAAMRMLLAAILAKARVEVVAEAWDGRQAVDLVAQHKPDIVCLDLEMPVMGGLDALQEIHANQPNAKVIMITGKSNRDSIMQAGKGGASGYILKPFSPEKVMEAIAKLLN